MKIEKVILSEIATVPDSSGGYETKRIEKVLKTSDFSAEWAFHSEILEYIDHGEIEDYAKANLSLISHSEARHKYEKIARDYSTEELIDELKNRGFETLKCQTLAEAMKLEELKNEIINY